MIRALAAGLAAVASLGAFAQDREQAATALADYVAGPDASYAWELRASHRRRGADVLELRLHSQTWRGALWKHQLFLIKPRRVASPGHGLLVIGGGRWRDAYDAESAASELPDDAAQFVRIAARLRTVVAVLAQVPYQPLLGLTEDRLIAHTFDQYLSTGDDEWPLLLPMVKSAVRAMDASSDAAAREWQVPLASFTVLGGSKRGWTAWLTAAVEPRVTALAPAVIDALNMERHFAHQVEVWGAPSDEIAPYTDLNLDDVLGSAAGAALRAIVDPFSYRASITQPKLVVLATNDRYFPVDSANLYWDGLAGPKYLLYLPNEGHSIDDYSRLVATLGALHAAAAAGEPLPRFEWEYRWDNDATSLCVRAAPAPSLVRTWLAASDDRDFREAVWQTGPLRRRGADHVFELPRPAAGYTAVFAEARFGRGRSAYTLSTNLAVLAAPGLPDVGPRAIGSSGVCDATGASE